MLGPKTALSILAALETPSAASYGCYVVSNNGQGGEGGPGSVFSDGKDLSGAHGAAHTPELKGKEGSPSGDAGKPNFSNSDGHSSGLSDDVSSEGKQLNTTPKQEQTSGFPAPTAGETVSVAGISAQAPSVSSSEPVADTKQAVAKSETTASVHQKQENSPTQPQGSEAKGVTEASSSTSASSDQPHTSSSST